MISRRLFVASFVASGFCLTTTKSFSAEVQTFTTEIFQQAQAAGKPVLVDISATWCPTCRAQAPIIEGLSSLEKFRDLLILKVDFDQQADVVRQLGARSQSTLIVFRGAEEIDRSVGSTDPSQIEALLEKAMKAS